MNAPSENVLLAEKLEVACYCCGGLEIVECRNS